MTLSSSQVDDLGERLRATDPPSAADRDLLAELLASYAKPLEDARTRIVTGVTGLGFVTGRLKSTPSIIDELKRSPATQLSGMEDLAGVRVVVNGGRAVQDVAAAGVRTVFPKSRTEDRCAAPRHGYRAVHVICEIEGKWVEVQIRTPLQQQWAELFDKLADRLGRQIRYGLDADDASRVVVPGTTRRDLVERVQRFSGIIARLEEAEEAPKERGPRSNEEIAKQTRELIGMLASLTDVLAKVS
ncbi:MAG: RelA/SpoT domain-containing protein [Deltaproteobacteria bacterium]